MTPTVIENVAGLKLAGQVEEKAAKWYFENTLQGKLVLSEPHRGLRPSFWVPTPLFESFRLRFKEAVSKPNGMTYVYFGPRRTGKTTASVAAIEMFLRKTPDGSPCLYVDADVRHLRQSFRDALGVPDHVSDRDLTFLLKKSLKEESIMPREELDGAYSNTLNMCPPVFVIDNLSVLQEVDIPFFDLLYRSVHEARILLFVVADNERTANMMCAMNGKARVLPFPDQHTFEDGTDWQIVEDPNSVTGLMATGIVWLPQRWTRKVLSKLIRGRFSDFDWTRFQVPESETGELAFIEDGDIPDRAWERAAAIIAASSSEELKGRCNFDDPDIMYHD